MPAHPARRRFPRSSGRLPLILSLPDRQYASYAHVSILQESRSDYSLLAAADGLASPPRAAGPLPSRGRYAAVLSTSSDCRSNDTLQIYHLTCHYFDDMFGREIGSSISPARTSSS